MCNVIFYVDIFLCSENTPNSEPKSRYFDSLLSVNSIVPITQIQVTTTVMTIS